MDADRSLACASSTRPSRSRRSLSIISCAGISLSALRSAASSSSPGCATVRGTYGTPVATTRSPYVQYVGPWGPATLRLRHVPNGGAGAYALAQLIAHAVAAAALTAHSGEAERGRPQRAPHAVTGSVHTDRKLAAQRVRGHEQEREGDHAAPHARLPIPQTQVWGGGQARTFFRTG